VLAPYYSSSEISIQICNFCGGSSDYSVCEVNLDTYRAGSDCRMHDTATSIDRQSTDICRRRPSADSGSSRSSACRSAVFLASSAADGRLLRSTKVRRRRGCRKPSTFGQQATSIRRHLDDQSTNRLRRRRVRAAAIAGRSETRSKNN